MKVHCEMCDSMVPVEEVHSSYDAKLVKQSAAEVAVIEAAKNYADLLLRYTYGDDVIDYNDDLIDAVRALRELEGIA